MISIRKKLANLEFNSRFSCMISKFGTERFPRKKLRINYLEEEVIFVHIPKTAGTSISEYLYEEPMKGHIPVSRLFYQDRKRFEQSFKFTFTREPKKRFESGYYHYIRAIKSKEKWDEKNNIAKLFKKVDSLEKFIWMLIDDKKYRSQIISLPIFRPQCDWITIPNNNRGQNIIGVDFIGRYERLEQDMDLLRERFGISIKSNLPRLRSGRKNSRNNECKCKAYEELINDIYEDDFRLLGYS